MHLCLPETSKATKRKVLQVLLAGDVFHLLVCYTLDGFRTSLSRAQAIPSVLYLASRVAFLGGFVEIP